MALFLVLVYVCVELVPLLSPEGGRAISLAGWLPAWRADEPSLVQAKGARELMEEI